MAHYTDDIRYAIRNYSVAATLEHFGCLKRDGHVRNAKYFSPFREEKTGSFHIGMKNGNEVWYDFGLSQGGGAVEFVMKYLGITEEAAYDYIHDNIMGNGIPAEAVKARREVRSRAKKEIAVPGVTVFELGPFTDAAILDYLVSKRCLDGSVVRHFLQQAKIAFRSSPGRTHTVAAWRQMNGTIGYRGNGPFLKGCNGQDITQYMKGDGQLTERACSTSCLVFEGHMDFLSWLTWSGRGCVLPCDVVVLNCVGNLRKALPFLRQHLCVGVLCDNDDAGRKCTMECRQLLEGACSVSDLSGTYSKHKDFNEMLMHGTNPRCGLKK